MAGEDRSKSVTINVVLPGGLKQAAEGLVEQGLYSSVSEVIREGIRKVVKDHQSIRAVKQVQEMKVEDRGELSAVEEGEAEGQGVGGEESQVGTMSSSAEANEGQGEVQGKEEMGGEVPGHEEGEGQESVAEEGGEEQDGVQIGYGEGDQDGGSSGDQTQPMAEPADGDQTGENRGEENRGEDEGVRDDEKPFEHEQDWNAVEEMAEAAQDAVEHDMEVRDIEEVEEDRTGEPHSEGGLDRE